MAAVSPPHREDQPEDFPSWAWWISRGLLIGAVVLNLGLLAATLSGVADPRPMGELAIDDHYDHPDRWTLAPAPTPLENPVRQAPGQYVMQVGANEGHLFVIAPYPISIPGSLEVAAREVSGQADVSYGLWWGQAPTPAEVIFGINSHGYLGILPDGLSAQKPWRDWALFPHVRPEGEINTFRADISGGRVTVRLNEEVAGQFDWAATGPLSAGVFVFSSQHGSGQVAFLSFRVWEAHTK